MAVANAMSKLISQGELERSPILHQVAAVSVGLLEEEPYLDLNYTEDVVAETDFNVVMNDLPALVEVQGTAETGSFSRAQLNKILDLAEVGIKELFMAQSKAIS